MSQGEYVLGDLLNDPHLGLELLTGGEEAYSIPLVGAHAIELENPSKWLDAGWMMLTMGVRLRNKPALQRQLINDLQDIGASCLGFGVGLSFKSVPPALLDEAKAQNFPVVLIPEQTQFRDITRAVFHSTIGIESTTFQRLSSIQQNLIRAFTDDNPLESIVQRLGRLVHSTVAVLSLDGKVDVTTGAIPVAEIVEGLASYPSYSFVQFDAADQRVVAAPVTAGRGPSTRWLVVSSRQWSGTRDLHSAAVQVTAPLIDAILRLNVTNVGQERATREAVLDSVLDGEIDAASQRTLTSRLNALGMDFASNLRVGVVRERPSGISTPSLPEAGDVVSEIHDFLEASGAHYLVSRREWEIVMLGSNALLGKTADKLVAARPSITVGIGRKAESVADIRASHRDAQITVQHLRVQPDRSWMTFNDLDVVTQLLAEIPADRFAATAEKTVELLLENPIQLEALRAFFANNRDVKAAADSIFLHPNTLRYRLERLENAMGRSLREPSVTASLYCVLTLIDDLAPAAPRISEQVADAPDGMAF